MTFSVLLGGGTGWAGDTSRNASKPTPKSAGRNSTTALQDRIDHLRSAEAAMGEEAADLWDEGKYDDYEKLEDEITGLGVKRRELERHVQWLTEHPSAARPKLYPFDR